MQVYKLEKKRLGSLLDSMMQSYELIAPVKKELVRFECQAWEPPTGGSRCDDCNNNPLLPCSEYRCRSLGQACEIANPGTTEEKCFWKSKGDTSIL